MRTRIREIRRLRGLTLQELASKVGTTAQTVQRLETDNMAISLDWLEKIASAFGLNVCALLSAETGSDVPLLGTLSAESAVVPVPREDSEIPKVSLIMPSETTIAVLLDTALGPFSGGTLLIANRLGDANRRVGHGRDCIIKTRSGAHLFRRMMLDGERPLAFIPYDGRAATHDDFELEWVAPIIASIRYF